MRLSIDALLVLDAIDRKGSFAAAAQDLHRVPSAVTYTIQKLERDLDIELFDRTGHKASLTAAGETLLREGRVLLRAASNLELSVKRIATGWEPEIRIAVGDLVQSSSLYPIIEEFYLLDVGTQVRLSSEVFGGTWDALASGRADIVLGTTGEGPAGCDYSARQIGVVPFVFVVPADHPLAAVDEPLTSEKIRQYRAVAAGDTSRNLPPRTSSLFDGQDVLTVPGLERKREAHLHGLGVGSMPEFMVRKDIEAGRLVVKEVEKETLEVQVTMAWQTQNVGNALKWFVERLEKEPLLGS